MTNIRSTHYDCFNAFVQKRINSAVRSVLFKTKATIQNLKDEVKAKDLTIEDLKMTINHAREECEREKRERQQCNLDQLHELELRESQECELRVREERELREYQERQLLEQQERELRKRELRERVIRERETREREIRESEIRESELRELETRELKLGECEILDPEQWDCVPMDEAESREYERDLREFYESEKRCRDQRELDFLERVRREQVPQNFNYQDGSFLSLETNIDWDKVFTPEPQPIEHNELCNDSAEPPRQRRPQKKKTKTKNHRLQQRK